MQCSQVGAAPSTIPTPTCRRGQSRSPRPPRAVPSSLAPAHVESQLKKHKITTTEQVFDSFCCKFCFSRTLASLKLDGTNSWVGCEGRARGAGPSTEQFLAHVGLQPHTSHPQPFLTSTCPELPGAPLAFWGTMRHFHHSSTAPALLNLCTSTAAAPSYQNLPVYAQNCRDGWANRLLGHELMGCSGVA